MKRFNRIWLAAIILLVLGAVLPTVLQPAGWNDWWRSAEEKRLDRIEQMVDCGVKVLYSGGHGSGVLFVRGEKVYVLTAAHVIRDRGNQPFRWLPQQLNLTKGSYGGGSIWIHRHRQSETIYTTDVFAAEMIAVDGSTDAAILRIKNVTPANFPGLDGGADFDLGNNKSLRKGMKTIHVGNFNASREAVTNGIISNPQQALQYGQPPLPNFRVIQISNMCAPGSSGGAIYLESNGKCIGILVRITGMSGNALVIPAYQIDQWLNGISDEMGLLLEQPE